MGDIFTSRETAIIIWIVIITIFALFIKQIRISILDVIKSAININVLKYLFFYLGYFSGIIYYFYHSKWWDIENLKDTIIWFIFSGLPIGFIVATNKLDRGFWKNLVLDNLKLMVLVEFIINSFTFSLVFELFLIPFITTITMFNVFSTHNKEYKPVEKLTNIILTFFGLIILFYSLYRAIVEIQSIENVNTLKIILFPVIFSIISVPYMYIFKLYVEYDKLFRRLRLGRNRSKELNLLIKLRLLSFCNIQLKKLQIAANMNNYNLMSISSKDEIDVMIRIYKNALSRVSGKPENAQTSAIKIIPVAILKPQVSTNTNGSETTLQFSDSKKEELVGHMTELYGTKEVKVIFIPPSKTSSNGLIAVDYYTDVTPTKTDLNNNIANIVILSKSLAEESGISNPNVSVCAMKMNGIPLGIGNYYSSTGKAIIDVSACP